MSDPDDIPPWLGDRFRRAFNDTFAPDRHSDEKEEHEHGHSRQEDQNRRRAVRAGLA